MQTYHGSQHYLFFDKELLEALSRRTNVTLFMLLLAVFKVLLYCLTGHPDIVVGTPVNNRQRIELEGLIGLFLNTLVLRTDLSGNPPFEELLARVREVVLGAHAHQELPFEMLVKSLQPERDLGRTVLFQVWFLYEIAPAAAALPGSVEMSGFQVDYGFSHYDLRLNLIETPEGITGAFEYNTDLFLSTTIKRLATQFESVLRLIAEHPEMRLDDLAGTLSEDERQRRLETQRQRKQANLDRLTSVRRRVITQA
jgi:non-ribosomal peptide synthetase component F